MSSMGAAIARLHTCLKHLVLLPVYIYRATISRVLPKGLCRFQPTCSQYMVDAVTKRGIIVGILKGLWRICRCNPFTKGGYDPVE